MPTKLHHDVRAFHIRFGHPVRTRPSIPTVDEMRFRLKLIAEEFLELIDAATDANHPSVPHLRDTLGKMLRHYIDEAGIKVDLPELVDAMGDLDYVVEGTRAVCGVRGAPVHARIHFANMQKDPVYVAAKDNHHRLLVPDPAAKPTKPEGWTPPDIREELIEQGWGMEEVAAL